MGRWLLGVALVALTVGGARAERPGERRIVTIGRGAGAERYAVGKEIGTSSSTPHVPKQQLRHAPAELRPVLARALHREQARRYATPNDLLEALEPFATAR